MTPRAAPAILLAAALASSLVACRQTTPDMVTQTAPEMDSSVDCLFSGTGATITVAGQRVNFNCGTTSEGLEVVLVGDVALGDEGWAIDQAVLERSDAGFEAMSSESVPIRGVNLTDGSVCAFAGAGTAMAIDGQRVSFTCGVTPDGGEIVLTWGIVAGDAGWTIMKATVSGSPDALEILETETATIESLTVPAAE